MSRATSSFIEHRVRALATVFLTGRNNVQTFSMDELGDLDFLCRIVSYDDEEYEMFFGVILKGTSESLSSEHYAAIHLNSWGRRRKIVQKYPFPVLALLFSMKDDEGYFAWEIEPNTDASNKPVLLLHERFTCQRANKAGLDTIVDRVRSWYSFFYKTSFQND
jgi:hypothetical protein